MLTTLPLKRGVVKQILSGDSIIIRGPTGSPPPEKQLNFSSIVAPKLARRTTDPADISRDEPYAWEAREFLRKKLLGETVYFTAEKPPNAMREYGVVYLGADAKTAENITESLVNEGLVSVRREGVRMTPEITRLAELEDAAKSAQKGKWGTKNFEHVRDIKWSIENMRAFLDKQGGKPIKAVIEHVRDGSTVRAFLLPDYYHITLMISGIRCPGFKLDDKGKPDLTTTVPYADEARYFVEVRLLQRDVEIVLESVNNNNFVGSILFPKGNIAELLLQKGLARCVDWSMAFMKTGADKLKAAERQAKDKKEKLWQGWQSNAVQITGKEKEFTGIVTEVVNGDALMVKLQNGQVKKIFLSSIRPPKEAPRNDEEGKPLPRPKNFRPLYDVAWMFEAREFLRKKLIDKRVNVSVDYKQEARDNFPEKTCATVKIGNTNVAEALVAKGYATVVRYRQDDDQRSFHYTDLLAAEAKALKSLKGIHAKKDIPTHRVNEIDAIKSKQYLPSFQRASRMDAIVEFVTSGSRMRLFLPKEHCLCTLLLGGINCPRGARAANASQPATEAEAFGEEALAFTRDRCMQRDVQIQVEAADKAGSFIGWIWTAEGVNLSVALVEEGLAAVHPVAERGEYGRVLRAAEDKAKAAKLRRWKDYVEPVVVEGVDGKEVDSRGGTAGDDEKVNVDRKIFYDEVLVTEVTERGTFYAQSFANGPKAEALLTKLRQEFDASPPLPGAYTPKRGDICAARYSVDDDWYRAKVEKIQGAQATVLYIDYGNTEVLNVTRLAALPAPYSSEKQYATEYMLAAVQVPKDVEYAALTVKYLREDTLSAGKLLLNVEYQGGPGEPRAATLYTEAKVDLARGLVAEGLLLVEKRRERRLRSLVNDYTAAQDEAKKKHLNIWEYGDITEDDAKEFGL